MTTFGAAAIAIAKRITRASHVQSAPQIPGGHRAVRSPPLSTIDDLLGCGQCLHSEHSLKSLTNSVVRARQDIHSAEPKDQQHLDAPTADAANIRELAD